MSKIKPLADRVIIEPLNAEKQTKGGIFIPDTAQVKQSKGKVIAVGIGTTDEPMEMKEGDMVLYSEHAGTKIQVKEKEYLIMRQCDVMAII